MTGYDFHPEAEADLNEIWGYIAADSVPDQGHKRPDLTTRPVRFKWVRVYLFAYAPDEKPLWVIGHSTDS